MPGCCGDNDLPLYADRVKERTSSVTKRAAVSIAGALVLLAGLVVAAAALSRTAEEAGSPSSEGPLRESVEHGMVAEGEAGSTFTDGFEVLQLSGQESATIVTVESVGGAATFRQLGAMLAGPDRKFASTTYYRTYPPTDRALGELVPAEGAVLQPKDETRNGMAYELLVGYEIVDDSRVGYRSGLEVTYRVGDELFLWESPARLLYCPEPMESDECHDVADADNWGE